MFILAGLLLPAKSGAATPYAWRKIAGGFNAPVAIAHPPGEQSRLFVAELSGKVRIVKDGQILTKPFLNLTDRISTQIFGQGFFDIVFHPNYTSNGYFYVLYCDLQGNPALARGIL